MSKFNELQNRHLELLNKFKDNQSSPQFIHDVEKYIEDVKIAGKEIGSSQERDQLRANLRFWGAFIFEQKKVYPDVTLWPSTQKNTRIQRGSEKTFLVSASILGGLVLLGLLCAAGYLFFSRNSSQQAEATAFVMATNQQSTIQVGMTHQAAAQALTQTAAPTNTVPPTNTPVIAEATFTPVESTNQNPAMTATVAAGFTQLANSTQDPAAAATIGAGLTQLAVSTRNPATATIAAGLTQLALSTQTVIATATALPNTGGEPTSERFSPQVTYLRSGCEDQKREITIAWRDFTWDTTLLPATSNIQNATAYLSALGTGDLEFPADVIPNGSVTVFELPNTRSNRSYLLQIKHSIFLFDPIIIQFTPDCAYNHVFITYSGYSDIINESTLDVGLVLTDWGPDSLDEPFSWVAMLEIRANQGGIYLYNEDQVTDMTFIVNGSNCVSPSFIVGRINNGKYQEAILSLYLASPSCPE
jgi:hypothetical protein